MHKKPPSYKFKECFLRDIIAKGCFDTEVLFLSYFYPEAKGYFDTAVSTIFWHAPKYGKNAPTQRGSGSVEPQIRHKPAHPDH